MQAHLNFVYYIAVRRRKRCRNLELEDLVVEGLLALYEAIPKFDLSRDVRLLTFCGFTIRQRITRAINTQRVIKIPSNFSNPKLKELAQKVSTCKPLKDVFGVCEIEQEIPEEYFIAFRAYVETLEGREREIIEMFCQGKSLTEIGEHFRVTGMRIGQIITKIGGRFKKCISKKNST